MPERKTAKKRTNNKRSESAKAVARTVASKIRNHQKINLYEILKEHGYAERTALRPSTVTGTKSFKEEMDPIVIPMRKARDLAVAGMLAQANRFHKLRPAELATVMKSLTHDSQLLAGEDTERGNFSGELLKLGEVLKSLKA